MISTVSFDKTTFEGIPYKFEAGTPNYVAAHALAVALDFVEGIGLDAIHAYERQLTAYATEQLSRIPGLRIFGQRLRGFDAPDAVLTGVETRSSCPVRYERDSLGESNIQGLFPAGEGAGLAGGIMSAAVDGLRQAENVLRALKTICGMPD